MNQTNKRFYDRISAAYDSIADANEHVAREAGERLLNVAPDERVVEVGFGTGSSLIHLAQSVGPGGKVCGVDVSEGMRDVAHKKIEEAGLADVVELTVANATSLDFADDSFDVAFLSFTLELFAEDDMQRVLRELKRVLRSGGRLGAVGMALVQEDEKESVLERTYVWMHQHFPHIVDCRPIDFASVIRDAGFNLVKEERMSIWTMPVAVVVASC